MKLQNNILHVFTDGSCQPNPGNGGIACVCLYNGKEKHYSEFIGESTNNIAELKSVELALTKIKKYDIPIWIYSDSTYTIGMLQQNWKAKVNIELVNNIKSLMKKFYKIKFIKVKGHSGNKYNELCDQLAKNEVLKNGN